MSKKATTQKIKKREVPFSGGTAFKVPRNTAPPVDPEILERIRQIGPCTISDSLDKIGYPNTYLRKIVPMALPEGFDGFVGIARTLRFVPRRKDLVEAQYAENTISPHRIAIEELSPGEVLMIDCGGSLESGVLGDIFTLRVRQRGGHAIVIDGAIRDLTGIKRMDFPVFSKGVHGAPIPTAQMSVAVNEPITCGGVCVVPGDIIVGNSDGVVAMPPQFAAEMAKKVYPKLDYERWIRKKLRAGKDLHRYYQHPPLPEVVEEYRKENNLPADYEV